MANELENQREQRRQREEEQRRQREEQRRRANLLAWILGSNLGSMHLVLV
jgi:hypothetical protein